ncbi:NAD-dependent epimerase/dehydratase family protein [Gramella sp. GC03-9]|uniref:NAD-dependent epimerase/dehydratase family protein n=1 Tax=Christiangramia oceanisediminis TaxID=2920386 RepID=A0A9X2KZ09_9FLAO|nr:NAD-dependent epimerase/dehydratase family protein [Gramella oceanisediminis]MCP9200834.1 NAD-dependent epimerase/dehydratase family protein [Gramella oceanisediminis]
MNSKELSGKKVLVTGATGFIGYRLAEILARDQQAKVTGAGRKLDKAGKLKDFGVELLALDLTSEQELDNSLTGVDFVFHCAGALGGDDKTAEMVNELATRKIVETAACNGVKRIVHISTVGVYDMTQSDTLDEKTPLALDHPSNYPRTKARGEKLAFKTGKLNDVEVVAIRPSMVYGPGDGVWTTMMYKNVCEGKPVFLGDGNYSFNPVYLDDVVDAMIKAATAEGVNGEAFNISSEVTTWKHFMNYYGDACNKKPKGIPVFMAKLMAAANKIPGVQTPIDKGFIEMATSNKFFPVDKAGKMLNWKPNTSLEEGMEKTIAWLKNRNT